MLPMQTNRMRVSGTEARARVVPDAFDMRDLGDLDEHLLLAGGERDPRVTAVDRGADVGKRLFDAHPVGAEMNLCWHDTEECTVMDLGLTDKLCVVTGASSGIGLATARRLGAEGARVLLVGRNVERLEVAAARCGGEYLAADVTDADADERIIATCAEQMGGIDVLVNNAGTSFVRSLQDLTDDDWRDQYELHVMAPMRLMRAAAPRMAKAGGGRIVNVCSSSGKRPSQTNPAYSVTKAAQLSLSRAFADAYARDGVLVNAVAPGPVDSELWLAPGGMADQMAQARGMTPEEALAMQRDKVPIGRYGSPDEIADVIVFLCSARASNVTGAAWSVDGGQVPVII